MSQAIEPMRSPRHGFRFAHIPTVRGSTYGGSIVRHYPDSYASILDCVFEMADDVATSNSWTHDRAIEQVLKDEGWRLLPRHRKLILQRLQ
jgi:hypothetical protein